MTGPLEILDTPILGLSTTWLFWNLLAGAPVSTKVDLCTSWALKAAFAVVVALEPWLVLPRPFGLWLMFLLLSLAGWEAMGGGGGGGVQKTTSSPGLPGCCCCCCCWRLISARDGCRRC